MKLKGSTMLKLHFTMTYNQLYWFAEFLIMVYLVDLEGLRTAYRNL